MTLRAVLAFTELAEPLPDFIRRGDEVDGNKGWMA
jgi:hypothetical protein